MEQMGYWEFILAHPNGQCYTSMNDSNPGYREMFVESLRCPSDTSGKELKGMGYGNIMLCYGDNAAWNSFPVGYEWQFGGISASDLYWNSNPFPSLPSDWQTAGDPVYPMISRIRERGFFASYYLKTFSSILDGLSNTIAAGESVAIRSDLNDALIYDIKGGMASYPGLDGALNTSGPQACLDIRGRDGDMRLFSGNVCWAWSGLGITDGYFNTNGFCAVLPPNSPSCNADSVNVDTGGFIKSASSWHSGGVNVVMGDGAVKFISETINCGNLAQPANNDGPSLWGVWGAMGSTNGGESTTL